MATKQIEETSPARTETISVVINDLSSKKIQSLVDRKRIIELELETIASTLFEAEGHEVPVNAQLNFSDGFKTVSFVRNVK